MMDVINRDDWRKVMLNQYSIFGTTTGLQVAALSIVASLGAKNFIYVEKIIFSIAALLLFFEVTLILWLVNQERKVAFNDENMIGFRKNERYYRNVLIIIMVSTWGLILFLLNLIVWS